MIGGTGPTATESTVRCARAPGKLVLSGAYSVLWGAEAVVTAVDRGAVAHRDREALHVSEEVAVAVRRGVIPRPCFVDVSELRTSNGLGGTRKLGLGSSAAALVATLAANGVPIDGTAALRSLFELALDLHREAQGGGSGIDVAASTFGGTLRFSRGPDGPRVSALSLPSGLEFHVFASQTPASTADLVQRVRRFAEHDSAAFLPLIERAKKGATAVMDAASADDWLVGLSEQREALLKIGDLAGAPIVTEAVRNLAERATSEGAYFGPSGAGGGDVAFFLGARAPTAEFLSTARSLGYELLETSVSAKGVHLVGAA